MTRRQITPLYPMRPARVAAALAALAMVTLTLGTLVVLPANADARDAAFSARRIIVEVIGPTRLRATTPTGERASGDATRLPRALGTPDGGLQRVAERSARAQPGRRPSRSLD
jgi:hypothetical protein